MGSLGVERMEVTDDTIELTIVDTGLGNVVEEVVITDVAVAAFDEDVVVGSKGLTTEESVDRIELKSGVEVFDDETRLDELDTRVKLLVGAIGVTTTDEVVAGGSFGDVRRVEELLVTKDVLETLGLVTVDELVGRTTEVLLVSLGVVAEVDVLVKRGKELLRTLLVVLATLLATPADEEAAQLLGLSLFSCS